MNLNDLIDVAIAKNASDVLLAPGSPPAIRTEGQLHFVQPQPVSSELTAMVVAQLLSPEQQRRLQAEKSFDFAHEHRGRRLRASAFCSNGGLGLAMRLLPATIATPSQLGLPPQLSSLLLKPEGLIVFTGATGQGKSTTQASLIDEVNRTTSRFIITLEDPIEYRHTSMQSVVDQRELGRDLVDFASALRHIVRQRPDIVMIAEMRDTQSIKSTLTLAETGHLVLSTLHTGDAVQAVARIVEEHPPEQQQLARSQLANVLLAVVHQRLVPGASGRLVMAAEVLMNTPAVARLIREGHTEQLYGAMELEHQAGSQTINQALAALVQQGRVLPGEAERFLISRESTALTPRGRKSR